MVAIFYLTLSSIWQIKSITFIGYIRTPSLKHLDRTCLVTHPNPAKTECCLTLQILQDMVFPTYQGTEGQRVDKTLKMNFHL